MIASAAGAFDAYLRVRHRLPDGKLRAGPVGAPLRADTLERLAEPFDVILLDAYGVLNVGETAIPGAAARIAAFRAAGKAVMVVSNSAGYPKRVMMRRYARLGFDFAPEEVVTSREALLAHLRGEPDRRWGLMLPGAHGTEDFEAAHFLRDDPAAHDAADGILMVGSGTWTAHRQHLLERSLAARPRPVMVGNPDIVAPREDGLSLEPGHYAHRLADATGIAPVFLGKPFADIFELALARLPARPDPRRGLMVGDTLHTDILGGRHLGFATALVTGFGSLVGLDVDAAIARAGIVPDFVVARI